MKDWNMWLVHQFFCTWIFKYALTFDVDLSYSSVMEFTENSDSEHHNTLGPVANLRVINCNCSRIVIDYVPSAKSILIKGMKILKWFWESMDCI